MRQPLQCGAALSSLPSSHAMSALQQVLAWPLRAMPVAPSACRCRSCDKCFACLQNRLDNMFVDSCSSLSLSAGQTYRQPLPYYNILENLHIHSMVS